MNHCTKTKNDQATAEGQDGCETSGIQNHLRDVTSRYRAHGRVQNLGPQTNDYYMWRMLPWAMSRALREQHGRRDSSGPEGRRCLTRKWLQTHTRGITGAWQVETCRKVVLGRGRTVSKGPKHSFPWRLQEQEAAPDGWASRNKALGQAGAGWENLDYQDKELGYHPEKSKRFQAKE